MNAWNFPLQCKEWTNEGKSVSSDWEFPFLPLGPSLQILHSLQHQPAQYTKEANQSLVKTAAKAPHFHLYRQSNGPTIQQMSIQQVATDDNIAASLNGRVWSLKG